MPQRDTLAFGALGTVFVVIAFALGGASLAPGDEPAASFFLPSHFELAQPEAAASPARADPERLDCVRCHVRPQDNKDGTPRRGRRAVVPEFHRTSHHLDPATLDNRDCRVCHEMTRHRQGRVRLRHVDDPEQVIVLVGDAEDEAAKLEPFCLACHDEDGAAGEAPFRDGRMPSAIDAAAWRRSPHATMTEGCFTCHGVHGTDDAALLRAPYSLLSSRAYAAADFQACWECHTEGEVVAAATPVGRLHAKHVKGEHLACVACHDPHGRMDDRASAHLRSR